jgi:hypothetical protein
MGGTHRDLSVELARHCLLANQPAIFCRAK